MDKILYGVAYYDEYMPYERLEQDIKMMQAAGINVVRIAESTWATMEPQNDTFDFTHVDRVIDAMEKAGIDVIVGTPTYAFPAWLAKQHPEVLAVTARGKEKYGRRQNMDITSPAYRFYAERMISKLIERVADRKCVIGYQLDNEAKHYDTSDSHVQQLFFKYLREKFVTLDALNHEFGFNYWSNRIGAWEDLPDVLGTINGSYAGEYEKFKRGLVNEYLAWQAGIVERYRRDDQFVTQNFDFEFRGYSYGMQPDVDHFAAAKCLSIAGVDIYHPTQDDLTGTEIAFGGDMTRSLKSDNYLVLETEAQGHPQWLPYDGQLRLQAYSHLASGAGAVMYWHWHSIHNAAETYWKGLLSHDLKSNATYDEAKIIGAELERIGAELAGLKKKNRVAILASNEALTALKLFPLGGQQYGYQPATYNDILRLVYDELYKLNIECDFLFPQSENFGDYDLIFVPALYSAPKSLLAALDSYVKGGGNLVMTFKSAVTNEHIKVYTEDQPAFLSECLGMVYNQFTVPKNVTLSGKGYDGESVHTWMELLRPTTAETIAKYDHPNWGKYAAITKNAYGSGRAWYIGCYTTPNAVKNVIVDAVKEAGLWSAKQETEFPVIIREGTDRQGRRITYYLNYSPARSEAANIYESGTDLLTGDKICEKSAFSIDKWGVRIVRSDGK